MRTWIRNHPLATAVSGSLLAIAATAVLDAVGLSGANVLPLIPLFFLFWYLQGLSRSEIGFAWGRGQDYALALFYPALVLGLVGLTAWLSGSVTPLATNWPDALVKAAFSTLVMIVGALVTEEGVFRDWLWASLQRAGVARLPLFVWTSVAFAAWHVSTALLPTPFQLPLAQVPVYILNAAVIGFSWALMRQLSGSIVVTSVSHGLWNGPSYTLFGIGSTPGALGIHNTAVFGPEVGWVGLVFNMAFAMILWFGLSRSRFRSARAFPQNPRSAAIGPM